MIVSLCKLKILNEKKGMYIKEKVPIEIRTLLYGWVSKYRESNSLHNIKKDFFFSKKIFKEFYSQFFLECELAFPLFTIIITSNKENFVEQYVSTTTYNSDDDAL